MVPCWLEAVALASSSWYCGDGEYNVVSWDAPLTGDAVMSTTDGGVRVPAGAKVVQGADSCPRASMCGWRLRGAMGLNSRDCAPMVVGRVSAVEVGLV